MIQCYFNSGDQIPLSILAVRVRIAQEPCMNPSLLVGEIPLEIDRQCSYVGSVVPAPMTFKSLIASRNAEFGEKSIALL